MQIILDIDQHLVFDVIHEARRREDAELAADVDGLTSPDPRAILSSVLDERHSSLTTAERTACWLGLEMAITYQGTHAALETADCNGLDVVAYIESGIDTRMSAESESI